jgi:GDPmannose 4,6-dehydratase
MARTALVAGITGQEGSYLAHHLLGLGYRVVGSSRDAEMADTSRLERLGVKGDVELVSLAPNDFRSVLKVVVGVQPDEIYNLAGQTSVGLSFEQPVECSESIYTATINLLEVIRFWGGIRFFKAGSSEYFGETGQTSATENTQMQPCSPCAVAKASACWQIVTYRKVYGMFACTRTLANHESPLRPKRFVTQKIIDGGRAIKVGRQTTIQLGNLDIWRDWGWAPDYVKAMRLMLLADKPQDYLITSGIAVSLRQFVAPAFEQANLHM